MKRNVIMLLGFFLISGCATTGPTNDTAASNAIYTNAPARVTFDASCSALKNLGYTIDTKDADNFIIKGSCSNILAGHEKLYAEITISEEVSRTKISCKIDRPGTIKALDVTGYYSVNNVYKEIVNILAKDQIETRKAAKEKQEKEFRESSGEGPRPPPEDRGSRRE